MVQNEKPHPETGFDPIAGVLALSLPGAGHLAQRKYKRAIFIAIGILGLYLGGLLIGGLSVVDRKSPRSETRISFIAQAFVGPIAFLTDYVHQTQFKTTVQRSGPRGGTLPPVIAPPGQNRMNLSLGKVNEIGVLYTVIAGMLNFIAFLDALLPSVRREQKKEEEPIRTTGALDAVLEKGAS